MIDGVDRLRDGAAVRLAGASAGRGRRPTKAGPPRAQHRRQRDARR